MIYYDTDSIKTDDQYLIEMQERSWAYMKAMSEAVKALEERLMKEAMEDEKNIETT